MVDNQIFIPGNVPSLKNGKIKTSRGVFSSKSVQQYISSFGIKHYSTRTKEVELKKKFNGIKFEEYFTNVMDLLNFAIVNNSKVIVKFHFVRGSKHKFDFGNAMELIADLMTAHNLLIDDNMDYFIPMPLKIGNNWYSYNKNNPGVIIKFDLEK